MWAPEDARPMEVEGQEVAMEVDAESSKLLAAIEAADDRLALDKDYASAIKVYRAVLDHVTESEESDPAFEAVQKVKEEGIYKLAQAYADTGSFTEVIGLLKSASPFFGAIAKARVAKIVRNIIDMVSRAQDSVVAQVNLCSEVVTWCNIEKRTFLRQRIQSRLASLLLKQGKYQEALILVNRLLRELKRLDDKQLLVETHLIESRINSALRNLPKSKAALTAARTASNAIYIAPLMQADLDQMSGTLHCEEGDYKTSFSYFLEAYEAFDQTSDARALSCLKYMILCKVLQGGAADVSGLLSGKWGIKYSGDDLDAMAEVADAAKHRSLEAFDTAVLKHRTLLEADSLIRHHLDILYNQLLESNLMKIIEPFSCVEISRVAELIHLPTEKVEKKLSQMILDDKLRGILDQGRGQLIIYEPATSDLVFARGLQVIARMSDVVDGLFRRAHTNLVAH
jgi:26S proteasome regulatory subunit N6